MDVPSTLYAQTFTTRQRETLDRLANYIEDWILITPDAGAIAAAVAGHAALTSGVHGISAFGATLIDDASASAARTTLGLGTIATVDKQLVPTLRFQDTAGNGVLEMQPAYASSPISGEPATPPGGTFMNKLVNEDDDHLWGIDQDEGEFSTGTKYTWWHKLGAGWQSNVTWVLSQTYGESTYLFGGQVTASQDGTNNRLLGYMDVPLNTQNATYTYALTDRGFGVGKNNTTAYTHTVPPNASVAFPIGTVIAYFNDGSAGDLTIAQGAGVTIVLDGTTTTGNRTVAPGGTGRLWKVDTNRWICGGSATT